MSDKPFPPSARRLALARQAGLTAASPVLVGGVACTAIALAVAFGRFELGDSIAAACTSAATHELDTHAAAGIGRIALSSAAPVVLGAAIAAILAQLAQTRTLWLPRRRIEHAPALEAGPAIRARGAAFELLATATIGLVTFGWLWIFAPRIAMLVELDPHAMLPAAASLGVSVLATIAIAWIALGVLDALAHHLALATALRMTAAEKREDDRLASADPRWARQRALLARDSDPQGLSNAVAGCAVIVLGDDVAVAIAWDATRRPIPTRVAIGRRARSTQLVGLARRHRVAVHHAPVLARDLGDGEGPVPEARWRELAEILAAVRHTSP